MHAFGRRRTEGLSADLVAARGRFEATVDRVEAAKRSLAAAAPGRRGPGLPLAEALAGFEAGLAEAEQSMEGWRGPEVEAAWLACREGLGRAGRRAQALRLGQPPEGYEQLYATLADLMEPLEAFLGAMEWFRTGPDRTARRPRPR